MAAANAATHNSEAVALKLARRWRRRIAWRAPRRRRPRTRPRPGRSPHSPTLQGFGFGFHEARFERKVGSMATPAPPLEHVRPRPERGRDAQPVDHLKVRQQRPAVAMARAPAHVLPRPAASVHLIAAARLVRVRARDRVSAPPARLPRVITVCT